MKSFTRILFSLATSILLLSSIGIGVSAKPVEQPLTSQESIVHQLGTTPPSLSTTPSASDIQPDGASAPGSGASTQDLSVSAYNYQVQDMGYRVYTDKWLTGATSMKVTVENWKLFAEYSGTNDQLTIGVCSSSNVCSNKKIYTTSTRSATFSSLNASTKYYVYFEVPTNGNRYSFNGAISKN